MLLCQVSIHLCCKIGFQAWALSWVPMSSTFIFLVPDSFFFFSFPSIEKASPSHSMNSHPRTSLLHLWLCACRQGREGTGEPHRCQRVLIAPGPALTYLRIIWRDSSCFKGTLSIRCLNYGFFSPLEELREGRCLSFVYIYTYIHI